MSNPSYKDVAVFGTMAYVDEDGVKHEFEYSTLSELYSKANTVVRMLRGSSMFNDYIAQRLVVTGEPVDVIRGVDLYADFLLWLKTIDSEFSGGRNLLYAAVDQLPKVRRCNPGNKTSFRGLQFKTQDDELI